MPVKASIRRKRVIVALALNVFSGQRKLSGMIDFFNKCFTCENRKWDMDILSGYERLTPNEIRRNVREGVDGFILLCHPPIKTIRLLERVGVPCVVETSADPSLAVGSNITRIFCDTNEISRTAARHFIVRQTFRSFCFVNTPEAESWSTDRCRYFSEAIAERGYSTAVCNLRDDNLAAFMRNLVKPIAVCAANDATARLVADVCLKMHLEIPDDVAILGFDDDPVFCLRSEPQLSSVAQDFSHCGYIAAQALDRLMRGEADVPRTLSYGARDIVIRESTMRNSPHIDIVQKALAYIDAHGCDNIGADDVARHLGVSRRLVDLRFDEILGHSIADIIRERKLEMVKHLLCNTCDSIADITAACGFANRTHLKNLFRHATGLSMRDYRNRFGDSEDYRRENADSSDRSSGSGGIAECANERCSSRACI